MEQPFDMRMTAAMVDTVKYLLHATHARIDYTQSDEISLVWLAESENSDVFFSAEVQKMCSVLASMTAAKFATVIPAEYRDRLAHFDARVFQLPSKEEAMAMLAEAGVDFESYPVCFRRGSFVRRRITERSLTDNELAQIPEKHRPSGPVIRAEYAVLDVPPFHKVANRVGVIFDGEEPRTQ